MTTTSPTIAHYRNGNVEVQLHCDGTKTREWTGTACPEFPESIDLKITDWCDAGCHYCHESSTVRGRHADETNIVSLLEGLPSGIELAIGGGNPLAHPKLDAILDVLRRTGFICNLTVNSQHVKESIKHLESLQQDGLIHGLGLSLCCSVQELTSLTKGLNKANIIVHLIAGVNRPFDALKLQNDGYKILILGYKTYGRGARPRSTVEGCLQEWNYWIETVMSRGNVGFDTLATKQLNLQARLPEELWQLRYQGDDGTLSLYVDAVQMCYAVNSTSERVPFRVSDGITTALDAFTRVSTNAHNKPNLEKGIGISIHSN